MVWGRQQPLPSSSQAPPHSCRSSLTFLPPHPLPPHLPTWELLCQVPPLWVQPGCLGSHGGFICLAQEPLWTGSRLREDLALQERTDQREALGQEPEKTWQRREPRPADPGSQQERRREGVLWLGAPEPLLGPWSLLPKLGEPRSPGGRRQLVPLQSYPFCLSGG